MTAMFLTSPFVFAQAPSIKVINEVLFHIQKKAYTAYDLRRFEAVKAELFADLDPNQQRILKSMTSYDAFVLYAICQSEAEALDLNIDPKVLIQLDQDKKSWKTGLLKANLYLQTKENLFAEKDRFNSWFQMLKNKYDYFKKNNSIST